jgi:hypothetical protein
MSHRQIRWQLDVVRICSDLKYSRIFLGTTKSRDFGKTEDGIFHEARLSVRLLSRKNKFSS